MDTSDDNDYLFTIKVKDMDSVPVITYKGSNINGLIDIRYAWHTKTCYEEERENEFRVEHADKDKSFTIIEVINSDLSN